jgi:undecaprenyl-diphosphatase
LDAVDALSHAVAGSLTFTNVGKAIVGRARPPLSDAVPPYEHAFPFLLVTR